MPRIPTRSLTHRGLATACLCVAVSIGCARSQFRRHADVESYGLIDSRQIDPLWDLPARTVEPQAISRMYVAAEQDCGPQPQDDVAARQYMDHPDGFDNQGYYGQIPTRLHTENPFWIDHLPRNPAGNIELTQPLAIDLSLLHSREYQTQFENVYLTALDLSGNRFEFDTQWFGGAGANFVATGSDLGDARALSVTANRLGLSRNLAGGGQFATSILNSLFWDFGSGLQAGSAALVTTFTQPLLRGAFRHVRLENLTQAERNLLYAVRDFARFRRAFYVDITTTHLNLLNQAQAIRNTQTNVENLRQNLIEHEFYLELGQVNQIQVDQVFQQYQNGRLSLLSAEQALISSHDAFKFQLGLPAWVPFEIDQSLLDRFELVDPALTELQSQSQELYESLIQYLPPQVAPKQVLLEGYAGYVALRDRVAQVLPSIEAELERWEQLLDSVDQDRFTADDRVDYEQQLALAQRVRNSLANLGKQLEQRGEYNAEILKKLEAYDADAPPPEERVTLQDIIEGKIPFEEIDIDDLLRELPDSPPVAAWRALLIAVGERLREEIAELYVAQNQIRLFLIEIESESIREEQAITFAHQNRLDLMNSKANVVDAFRKVEVAADALESDLSVSGGVTLGSDPSKNNAFRFDSSANRYRVGVEFDGPLNRLNERNAYRATQIAYQQASRNYIADKDRVANEVRSVLRQLELRRLNFQIARQQVVAATRQVDLAQIDLRRSSSPDSNLTLNLLTALQGLLDGKNNLISNWIQYRVQKMRLFAALEILYLDENGQWINEQTGMEMLEEFNFVDPEYFPAGWLRAGNSSVLDAEVTEPGGALERVDGDAEELPLPNPDDAQHGPEGDSDRSLRRGVVSQSLPYSLEFGR